MLHNMIVLHIITLMAKDMLGYYVSFVVYLIVNWSTD